MLDELKELGVNVDEGLEHVMGDSALYDAMLWMFINSVQDAAISPEDFDAEDLEGVIKKVLTLKSAAENLELTPLIPGYSNTLELLGRELAEQAREEYERLAPVQTQILDCIKASGL